MVRFVCFAVLTVLLGIAVGSQPTTRDVLGQDASTDADRIAALETRVAELVEDIIALTTDYSDQLLPEPRPISEYVAGNFEISDDAVTLFCAQYPLDDYHLAVTCDQVIE